MSDDWALFGKTIKVRIPAIIAAIAVPPFLIWYSFFGPRTNFAFDILGVSDARHAVEDFMVAARDGDTARATSLTDSRTISNSQLDALLQRRDLFDGYKSLNVGSYIRQTSTGFGDMMFLQGTVTYSSGPKGHYSAVLVKRDGRWIIQQLFLQRSP